MLHLYREVYLCVYVFVGVCGEEKMRKLEGMMKD